MFMAALAVNPVIKFKTIKPNIKNCVIEKCSITSFVPKIIKRKHHNENMMIEAEGNEVKKWITMSCVLPFLKVRT